MLLVQMTIGGTVHYLSNEFIAIEHFYEAHISSMSSVRFETREIYGGYAEPTYGKIELIPSAFTGSWPPPVSCALVVMITATNEAAAQTLFEGTAHLVEISSDTVTYDLYAKTYDFVMPARLYGGAINQIFMLYCANYLSLDTDFTYARSTAINGGPVTRYNATSDMPLIDILSYMAAAVSHRFYIIGDTLYLIDCLLDNGPVLALTEFDIFPSKYTNPKPYKSFKAPYTAEIDTYKFVFKLDEALGPTRPAIGNMEIQRSSTDTTDLTYTVGGTASGDYYSVYTPARAVDTDAATNWIGEWVYRTDDLGGYYFDSTWQFEFNSPQIVEQYRFYVSVAVATYAPLLWDVIGVDSAVGVSGTLVEAQTASGWVISTYKTFSIPIPQWHITISGSSAYGEEFTLSNPPSIDGLSVMSALSNVKTILERKRIEIVLPLDTVPRIGQKITLTDDSLLNSTSIWARVSAIVYDFDKDECVIEGEGEIS